MFLVFLFGLIHGRWIADSLSWGERFFLWFDTDDVYIEMNGSPDFLKAGYFYYNIFYLLNKIIFNFSF